MTSAPEILDGWHVLDALPRRRGELTTRDIGCAGTRLAVGTDRSRHVLLPADEVTVEERAACIQVLGRTLIADGEAPSRFVDVACGRPELEQPFAAFVSELLEQLTARSESADELSCALLREWQALFEESGSSADPRRVRGMFGELWILRELVQRNPDAVACWRGPDGAPHDFELGRLALEIKTIVDGTPWLARISGVEQLESPVGGALYLGLLALRSDPDGESLRDIVLDILAAGVDARPLLARVRCALSAQDAAGPERFSLTARRLHQVDDHFPRIVPASFVTGGLSWGVESLDYAVDCGVAEALPPAAWDGVLSGLAR